MNELEPEGKISATRPAPPAPTRRDLVFGMAGSGGDGIVSAGDSLLQAAAAEGYHGIMTKSFGSQIRGGESSCRVRISTDPLLNPGGNLDVAVALNWEDFLKFGAELPVSGTTVVIYEAATNIPVDQIPLVGVTPLQVIAVPIAAMAKATAGTERAKNTVVLGLIAGWFGIGAVAVMKGIRKKLKMTQVRFSDTFGFSLDAVKHWEGGRRTPEASARAFLTVIARNPVAVIAALHTSASPKKRTLASNRMSHR